MHYGILLATLLSVAATAHADEHIDIARFSALRPGAALPAEWKASTVASIEQHTRYTLVDDGGRTVLRAEARSAASGLTRKVRFDPALFPRLQWQWKIDQVIENADLRSKSGDDFPARLYVMFDYPLEKLSFGERNLIRLARTFTDPELPAATLCYVWDNKTPPGSIVTSPYYSRVKVIVVESGNARAGQWVPFERDLSADFRAAFGDAVPPVTAIAIAADTDNTGAVALTHFGDIVVKKQQGN